MNNREIRSMTFEVRAEENEQHGAHLVGMPIVYGQVIQYGWRREVIDQNAVDADTDLKDVRFLIGHNISMVPLARSRKTLFQSSSNSSRRSRSSRPPRPRRAMRSAPAA